MTRIVKFYKRLLDVSLLTSYALLVLLVFFMLYGVFSGAYQFTDSSQSMIKDGFAFLRTSLILIVTAIVVSVVAARVFLAFIQKSERLETAETYRKKLNKSTKVTSKTRKTQVFSETDAYKLIRKQSKESVASNIDEVTKPKEEQVIINKQTDNQNENNVIEEEESIILEETVVEDLNEEDSNFAIEEDEDEVIVVDVIEPEAVAVVPEVLVTDNLGTKTTTKKFYTRLNKTELNKIIAKVSGLSVYKSRKFLNTFLDIVKEELVAGNDVKIDDFGKFDTKLVKEHMGINPRTMAKLVIPEHRSVKFTAYKKFKDDITNEVTDTSIRYLLTKTVVNELSEDEVQNELIKEEKVKEHIEVSVIKPILAKKPKVVVPKKTKADLIRIIDEQTDLSKNKANKFLKYFAEVIKEELANKRNVKIADFGTFTTIHIPAKEAVNPSNQQRIIVPEHNQVRLRFEKSYKDKFK